VTRRGGSSRGRVGRDIAFALFVGMTLAYLYREGGDFRLSPRRVRPPSEVPLIVGSSESLTQPGLVFELNQQAVDLSELAEFRAAAASLETALRLAPDDAVVARNLQTVLLNWGTSEMLAGNLDEARRLLERAQALGERPEVLRALGMLMHRQRDFESARQILERARRGLPRDNSVLLALGDSYLRLEKRDLAFDVLQQAREAGAGSPGLSALLQRLGREIDAEWDFVQLQTANFQASFSEAADDRAVRIVLDALEEAHTTVGRKLGYYPAERTAVVLYAQEDFHSATMTPDWAGGAFDGRIKVPLRGLQVPDAGLTRALRHEYAHSILATLAGPGCPVWLNEGLAVWAEEDEEGEREDWAWDSIERLGIFRFADLDGAFVGLPARRVEAAYAQSYLVVRALVDRYGAQGLRDFLDALRRSRDPEQALAELFGDSWTGLLHGVEVAAKTASR